MSNKQTYPALTAFRVYYDDGTSGDTNMAANVTLEEAQKYFVGNTFEVTERKFRTAVRVEKLY